MQYYRYAKGEIRTQTAEQIKADRARERFEARQARLEREQAEKEARRRARLEANRKKQEAATDSGAGDEKLAALKKEVGQASSAYKAAVKAAKTAEAQEADNAAELRARADANTVDRHGQTPLFFAPALATGPIKVEFVAWPYLVTPSGGGAATHAHVGCLAKFAREKAQTWWKCPTCGQRWTGPMSLVLARRRHELAAGLPEADDERKRTTSD